MARRMIWMLWALTVSTGACYSQSRRGAPAYWNASFPEARAKAGSSRKILFVWLAAPDETVFRDKTLMDSLQAYTVGVRLSPHDPALPLRETRTGSSVWAALEAGQSPPASFAFLDTSGICLARGDSAAPSAGYVVSVLSQALDRKAHMEDARALEEEWRAGNKDPLVLEGIITEKAAEGLPTDSLLQVYVDGLSRDSLGSVRVVRFLALQAPLLNSEANQWLRQDPGIFKEAWNSLTPAQQVQVNSAVIRKTCAKAVRDRDLEEARLAAVFAANTHIGAEAKVRAFQGVMMDYYYGVGDTILYEDAALAYYNHFLMPLNADSLRTQDSLRQRFGDRSVCRYVSGELRRGGLRFYRLGVTDTLQRVAFSWVSRADFLEPTPQGLDLEARLALRMGDKARATALEKRAVRLAKADNEIPPD